jgi:nicotinate-nucleotide pyrophosphorylase (carboxylating)
MSPYEDVARAVQLALDEDLSAGDITTRALIPPGLECRAYVVAKGVGVLAGIGVAGTVFETVDPDVKFQELAADGSRLQIGQRVAMVEGVAGSILKAERTALNFLQHLSGVATETAGYVEETRGTKAMVLDTRKTLPGLRALQKYAVRVGGGGNHRLNLGDGLLIKDNHIAILRSIGVGLADAVRMAREQGGGKVQIEVEVESVEAAEEALVAGADIIMVDNMSVEDTARVTVFASGRALVEASGGITMSNIAAVAGTGVDMISIGALTHSSRSLDMSLEIDL